MDSYQEKYRLQQHAARTQGCLDSNNAMIEFSKMVLRGLMILNGTAIIPIIYSKVEYLYPCALIFALGSFFAACAASFTYLTQGMVFNMWSSAVFGDNFETRIDQNGTQKTFITERKSNMHIMLSKVFRFCAMLFVTLSIGSFLCGLVNAQVALNMHGIHNIQLFPQWLVGLFQVQMQ